MGKINKSWNDRGEWLNLWDRRRRDPLYTFPSELFYTTEAINVDRLENDPPRPDKYGIYHMANA